MNSITKKSLTAILDSLNSELKSLGISRDLNVFGSGALMLLEVSKQTRETTDLDMLSPTGDVELLKASEIVAKKHELDNEWLNSIGYRFSKYLPAKWDSRLVMVYEGTHLKVMSLSKTDLLFTKAKAFYSRGIPDDLEDLMSLGFKLEDAYESI